MTCNILVVHPSLASCLKAGAVHTYVRWGITHKYRYRGTVPREAFNQKQQTTQHAPATLLGGGVESDHPLLQVGALGSCSVAQPPHTPQAIATRASDILSGLRAMVVFVRIQQPTQHISGTWLFLVCKACSRAQHRLHRHRPSPAHRPAPHGSCPCRQCPAQAPPRRPQLFQLAQRCRVVHQLARLCRTRFVHTQYQHSVPTHNLGASGGHGQLPVLSIWW